MLKRSSFTLFLIVLAVVKCDLLNPDEKLNFETIQIDEELDPNTQIANLTKLLIENLNINQLNLTNNKHALKLESIQFERNEDFKEQQEYFSIDFKETRYDDVLVSSSAVQTNSISLLKVNGQKRLDREYMCRAGNLCSCESDCVLNISLSARFRLLDVEDRLISLKLNLPVRINDINDNKPFFYQKEIRIDLDLDKSSTGSLKIPLKLATDLDSMQKNRIKSYDLILDTKSSALNQPGLINLSSNESLSIELGSIEALKAVFKSKQVEIEPNYSLAPDFDYFSESFQLRATDPDYVTLQEITIKFKLPKLIKQSRERLNKPEESTSNSKLIIFDKNFYNLTYDPAESIRISLNSKIESSCILSTLKFKIFNLNKINIISKLIYNKNENYLLVNLMSEGLDEQQQQFKITGTCERVDGSLGLSDVALLILNKIESSERDYASSLMVNMISALNGIDIVSTKGKVNSYEILFRNLTASNETNANSTSATLAYLIVEQKTSGAKLKLESEQFVDELGLKNMSLFQINEMRNGLYSIRLLTSIYETIKDSYAKKSGSFYTYSIKLRIKQGKVSLSKTLAIKLPSGLINEPEYELATILNQQQTQKQDANSQNISAINLFNSVIIITTASVILIVFGIACFVVSLSLYITSKCKQKKAEKTNSGQTSNHFSDKNLFYSPSCGFETTTTTTTDSEQHKISSSESTTSSVSPIDRIIKPNYVYRNEAHMSNSSTSSSSLIGAPAKTKESSNIMVYDMLPSDKLKKQQPQIYTLSSASSSCSNQSPNNISPVTTATTSISNCASGVNHHQYKNRLSCSSSSPTNSSQPQASNGPLFETNLNDKDMIYEWFLQSNMNSSQFKAANEMSQVDSGIKPLELELAKHDEALSLNLSSQYRNEIYRNSHLIFRNANSSSNYQHVQSKQAQNYQINSCSKSGISVYEARPINLHPAAKESNDEYNLNSRLAKTSLSIRNENGGSVRSKALSRLNAAMEEVVQQTTSGNGEAGNGQQISCV